MLFGKYSNTEHLHTDFQPELYFPFGETKAKQSKLLALDYVKLICTNPYIKYILLFYSTDCASNSMKK